MTEDHPFNNRNFYGVTKFAGLACNKAYFDRYSHLCWTEYMRCIWSGQNAAYSGVIPIMLNHIDMKKNKYK